MTNTTFIVKPGFVSSWDDEDSPLEFRVTANTTGDLPACWYTVIATPTTTKAGFRFAVYSGSHYQLATMRRKAQMDTHSATRKAVIEAVKAYLAAQ